MPVFQFCQNKWKSPGLLLGFCLICLSCALQKGIAQDYYTAKTAPAKAQAFYKKSRDYAFNGDRENARKEAEKALKAAPGFIEAMYLIADLDVVDGRTEEADFGFSEIIRLAPDYMPRVMYTYGIFLYEEERFEEAAGMLNRFLTYPQKSDATRERAERTAANAEFAAHALANPVPFSPLNMGENVNSKWAEYWPSLSIDGQSLIFTRNDKGNEDFYVSKKAEDNWEAARNIGAPFNTPLNEGAQSVSADGRYFVYTVCNRPGDYGKCDLYFSEYVNDKSTEPKNIGAPVNSGAWESQPSLGPDGKTLFFCRAGDNRDPNKDIWVSYRDGEGLWSTPEKLSSNINSPYSEEAPFMHPDGQTLYFLSDGHPGMGGADLFLSRKIDGKWSPAKNLGYPLNTSADELSIIVSLDGKTAIYASNREGGYGSLDLYTFEMPPNVRPKPVTYAEGFVTDFESGKPLEAQVKVVNLENGKLHHESETNEDGKILICLPTGVNYAFNVEKEGYLFHSEHFALKGISSMNEPFRLPVRLNKIPVLDLPGASATGISQPVILKNVFFETGSADLLPQSISELQVLKKMMTDNPAINVRINGHTDSVGTDQDNLLLSENRAKAVMNYLISEGISPARLGSKGFGEKMPIASNDTEEGKALNRRTEFEVVK